MTSFNDLGMPGEFPDTATPSSPGRRQHRRWPSSASFCYTNHAEADMDTLLTLIATAGVTYVMGVPGADDIMLNFQSMSFHDQLYIREVTGLRRAPEFEEWLQTMGMTEGAGRLKEGSTYRRLLGVAA